MGAASNGQCFSTTAQAAQAACTSAYPVASAGASAPVVVTCSGVTAAGDALQLVRADGTSSVLIEQPVSFPVCDPLESYADASLLWMSGLVAVTLIWCFKNFILKLVMNQ